MSLRLRITIFYVLLVLPALVLLGLGAYSVVSDRLREDADRTLVSYLEGVEAVVVLLGSLEGRGPLEIEFPPAPDFELKLLNRDGELLYASSETGRQLPDPAELDIRPGVLTDVTVAGTAHRVAYQPLIAGSGELAGYAVASTPSDGDTSTLSRLRNALLLGGLGLTVVTGAGAYLFSSVVVRPLRKASRQAAAIEQSGDFTERLRVRAGGELGELVGSFNAVIERVEHTLLSQRGFLADSSHELRRPLAVIRTNIDVLSSKDIGEVDRISTLEDIKVETEMITRLISDLLFISRGETHPFERQEVDLVAMCAGLIQRGRRWDPAHHHGFSGEGEVVVLGDPMRLEQMVQNLLENAAQNTPAGGLVLLKVEREDQMAKVSVIDSGSGIPEDEQPHIFERYYRGRSARRTRQEGAGLGLFIVQFIAESHGGRVGFLSESGKGSIFVVELPAAR